MKKRYMLTSAFMAGIMLLSGCGNNTETTEGSATNAPAVTADEGNNVSGGGDYTKATAPTKAVITESKAKGNSGEVKLEEGDLYAVISVQDYGDITVKLYPEEAPYAVRNFVELANKGTYNGRNFHRVISGFMAQGGSANGDGTGGASFEGGSFKNEINTSLRHYYGAFCYASAMGDMSDQFYIVNNKENIEDIASQYNQYKEYYTAMAEQYGSMKEMYADDSSTLSIIDIYVDFYKNSADGAAAMANSITNDVIEKYKNGGTPSLDGGYTVFGQTVDGFDVLDKISAVETVEGSDGAMSKPKTDIIISSVKIFNA